MGEQANAIRVSDHIEKVFVDFSSYESLQESTGFRRLYTIHTAETNRMSVALGFHVGGFCDDHGRGGPALAASTAGYPQLPSDLILCQLDDRYDFLPLDKEQLNQLYGYLVGEDAAEEVEEDQERESLDSYFVEVHMDSTFPLREDKRIIEYTLMYVPEADPEDRPILPYYRNLLECLGVDEIREQMQVRTSFGDELTLSLDESVTLDFEDGSEENPDSFSYGQVTLTLHKVPRPVPGKDRKVKILVEVIDPETNEILISEPSEIKSMLDEDAELIYDYAGRGYLPLALSEDGLFGMVAGFCLDEKDPDQSITISIPLWGNKKNIDRHILVTDEGYRVIVVTSVYFDD